MPSIFDASTTKSGDEPISPNFPPYLYAMENSSNQTPVEYPSHTSQIDFLQSATSEQPFLQELAKRGIRIEQGEGDISTNPFQSFLNF